MRIADDAQVNYRGFQLFPPSLLTVGAASIFNGTIYSDRKGSEVSIGTNSFVGNSSIICAQRVEIGDDVLISWGCTIVDHDSHSVYWTKRQYDVNNIHRRQVKDWTNVRVQPVYIRNRAWLGFDVTVLRGVTVGEGAVVGARSVVTKDVAPYTIAAGNPARHIREIDRDT